MKLRLAENIRLLRKERRLTQENLAEALGVTVGAVYKWESGLSQPELGLIVELADFFDTSVDALLGYRLNDNRLESALERMAEYCRTLDPEALVQAEKILAKYPHSFRAVYQCAGVYLAYAAGSRDKAQLNRARELLEQAKLLIGQSDDKSVSESSINGAMAHVLLMLGEKEKCLELLKRSNGTGEFNHHIGACLAVYLNRTEEAVPYLTKALLNVMSTFFDTILSYVFVYCARKDWNSALAMMRWGLDFLSGLRLEEKPDALEKIRAEMLAALACVQSGAGLDGESEATLRQAADTALAFDSMPDYSLKTARFGEDLKETMFIDAFGATATGSIKNVLELAKDEKLAEKWEEIIKNGN